MLTVAPDGTVAKSGFRHDLIAVEFIVFVVVEPAAHQHPAIRAGGVLEGQEFGCHELRRCVLTGITGLALRARKTSKSVAQDGGVLPFSRIENGVSVHVKSGVNAKSALVTRCKCIKGFGFDQPGRRRGVGW